MNFSNCNHCALFRAIFTGQAGRVLALFSVSLLILFSVSVCCGKKSVSTTSQLSPKAYEEEAGKVTTKVKPRQVAIADVILELEGLTAPDDVDEGIFEQIKLELSSL